MTSPVIVVHFPTAMSVAISVDANRIYYSTPFCSFPHFSDLLCSIPCHKTMYTYLCFTITDVISEILVIQNKIKCQFQPKSPYICHIPVVFAKESGKSPG